jgi:Fe-S-cluster containining protein
MAASHPNFDAAEGALERYRELLEEDQQLRHAEYDRPDPKRRRLRVMCNQCETPWCCNQRVEVDLVEALVIHRWASIHQPRLLQQAVKRGRELAARPALDDAEFFRRKTPCPLLERGQCGVFAVRPMRCRTHYMAGNPQKCRDQLQPSETYAMSPDRALIAEIERTAEEAKFDALIEGAPERPRELAETLALVDALLSDGARSWRAPRAVGWDLVGGPPARSR